MYFIINFCTLIVYAVDYIHIYSLGFFYFKMSISKKIKKMAAGSPGSKLIFRMVPYCHPCIFSSKRCKRSRGPVDHDHGLQGDRS
jgi:hypothetical protein